MKKRCIGECKEEKEASSENFGKDKSQKDNFQRRCIPCQRSYMRNVNRRIRMRKKQQNKMIDKDFDGHWLGEFAMMEAI